MPRDPSAVRERDQASGGGHSWRAPAAWLVLGVLSACGPRLDPIEQVRVFGGRPPLGDVPPVPGADARYPNLGTVPPRPVPPPEADRRRVAEALVADRENARHIGAPRREDRASATVGVPPAATVVSAGPLGFRPEADAMAGMVGPDPLVASPVSPPPIAGAPPRAPSGASPGSLPEPAAAAPVPSPPASMPSVPPAAALPPRFEPSAPPPALAPTAQPASPPPASAAGDPSVIVDRAALPVAAHGTVVQPAPAGPGAAIAFARGSAVLLPTERETLVALARIRGAAALRVVGFVDSPGDDLGLALARAQAVAQALRAAKVPAEAVEIGAEARPGAAGRGAEVRLVY